MIRIGVDVGGTNTDAVIMDGSDFVAGCKRLTTPDIISGVRNALAATMEEASGKVEGREDRYPPAPLTLAATLQAQARANQRGGTASSRACLGLHTLVAVKACTL